MQNVSDRKLGLRGSPRNLTAMIPMPPVGPGLVPVELEIPEVTLPSPLLAAVVPYEVVEAAQLTLSLPGATPPGRYEGEIKLSERTQSLVVDVEPFVSCAILPHSLVANARAGEALHVELTLLNQGNVAYEVRASYAFPLVDAIGIDRALRRFTASETKAGGPGRADRFFDELARGRGGPVRVDVHRGDGPVMPREMREIEAALKLPSRLQQGRAYSGSWRLADAAFSIRVEIGDQSIEEEAR